VERGAAAGKSFFLRGRVDTRSPERRLAGGRQRWVWAAVAGIKKGCCGKCLQGRARGRRGSSTEGETREERGAARQAGRRVAGPVLLRSRKRSAKIHGLLPAAAEKNERACVFIVSEEIGLWGVGGRPRPWASLAGPC
jgi:hypothetical protein